MPRPNETRQLRAATLADVGKLASVSAMAASAVLNGARTSSRISDETRERILKAAAKLHYRPNAAARALANRRMNTLGVACVIDSGAGLNHYFMQVFNGILDAAARHDQNTTVFALHDWTRDLPRLRGFCDGRIDGMILLAPLLQPEKALLPTHTPFVTIHSNFSLPNIVNVESDEEQGAFEMVRHLIGLGHRRIMHLSGPSTMVGPERRIHGYRRALASAHLPFDPSLLVPADFLEDGGREAMRGWLRKNAREPVPEAIFCANDATAVGCMEALAEVGIRVPDDVSIGGFDDTLAARTTVPQLTTVRQPLRAMGACATDLLLERISERDSAGSVVSNKSVVFPTELIARASAAKRADSGKSPRSAGGK